MEEEQDTSIYKFRDEIIFSPALFKNQVKKQRPATCRKTEFINVYAPAQKEANFF